MNKRSARLLFALAAALPAHAFACGSEPYIGEICLFPYQYCPSGYAEANGQLLPISSNSALFSLVGTTFGGDGISNFGLPDLRGRAPVGFGSGNGLSPLVMGQAGGVQSVTLTQAQMPTHQHTATTTVNATSTLNVVSAAGNASTPVGKVIASSSSRDNQYSDAAPTDRMATGAVTTTANATTNVGAAGSSQPVATQSPYLALRYCIAMQGVYPSRP